MKCSWNIGNALLRALWRAALLAVVLPGNIFAATEPASTTVVLDRGPHHETREIVTQVGDGPDATLTTNRYTLLQPGMNYLESNEWKSASTQIDLTPGGARYRKGPFGLKFQASYKNAPMEATLPDGRTLKIQTVGLALTHADGDSIWLGESKNVNGFLDADGSSIVYPDAFDGARADIVVRVGTGRFESDVVIREQLLDPAALNWDPAQVKLEIWHALVQAPQMESYPGVIHRENGQTDPDEQLGFGDLIIGQGSAFLMGTNKLPLLAGGKRVQVAKERFRDPQSEVSYLIESVPYLEAAAHLGALPARQEARINRESILKRLESVRNVAASTGNKRHSPVSLAGIETQKRESNLDAMPGANGKQLASIQRGRLSEAPGFVMDYAAVVGGSNLRLKGDTTYYVTSEVNFFGTTTIEAGTVVKFTNFVTLSGSSPALKVHGALVCLTTPYAPAVFTAQNDKSVGEIINVNDTSAPSGYYANYNLLFTPENASPIDVHDIQTRYAHYGLGVQGSGINKVSNVQALKCSTGVDIGYNVTYVRNLLAQDVENALNANSAVIHAEHVTARNATVSLFSHTGASSYLNITNSLLVAVASPGSNVKSDNVVSLIPDTGVFATVGAGANYLAAGSPYRNVGNPNLSPEMKAILKTTTTYPPIELKNAISTSQTLRPRVLLDEDAPDLGYHFYPLDYLWTELPVTGATLFLTNGVRVAWYGKNGIFLAKDSRLISEGKPNHLNRIVRYTTVQEQPTVLGVNYSGASAVLLTTNNLALANRPDIQLRFTDVALQAIHRRDAGFSTDPMETLERKTSA